MDFQHGEEPFGYAGRYRRLEALDYSLRDVSLNDCANLDPSTGLASNV